MLDLGVRQRLAGSELYLQIDKTQPQSGQVVRSDAGIKSTQFTFGQSLCDNLGEHFLAAAGASVEKFAR